MKKVFPLLITAFFCLTRLALAGPSVVELQSSRLLPYEQARQGLEQMLTGQSPAAGIKSIQAASLSRVVLGRRSDRQSLKFTLQADPPQLLVAIGAKALAFAVSLDIDRPIVYLLVPDPKPIIQGRRKVTGVRMMIPPARQIEGFTAVLPSIKRIGTIYDPRHSAKLVAQARTEAARLGIELRAEKASSPEQVPELLSRLRGKIDSFWILPDLTVLTPQTLKKIFFFSFSEKIPVLSFSERYLSAGAAVAVSFNLTAMGEKAGKLALEILQGQEADALPPVYADKVKIVINREVLDKLGRPYCPEAFAVWSSEAKR